MAKDIKTIPFSNPSKILKNPSKLLMRVLKPPQVIWSWRYWVGMTSLYAYVIIMLRSFSIIKKLSVTYLMKTGYRLSFSVFFSLRFHFSIALWEIRFSSLLVDMRF